MSYRVLGIDPGLTGAVATYDGTVLDVWDIPTVRAASRGRDLDWTALARLIGAIGHVDHAFIERVGARPGQGTASMFKFGSVFGGLRGIVAAHAIPVTLVTPRQWKARLGVGAAKDAARARASELLPHRAERWARRCDDGRAEAALLAVYGLRELTGG